MTDAPEDEESLARAVSACHDDPLNFVETVFPWGEGALAEHDGPDAWQRALLDDVRAALARGDSPVRMAVASGHGVGKTALSAWLILWFLSTRDHPQLVVTANPLASAMQVRLLPPAPIQPNKARGETDDDSGKRRDHDRGNPVREWNAGFFGTPIGNRQAPLRRPDA